ncbi:MAG: tryptophan--tRNA ligase [Planctomycetes bacterium]|nr:tryptophan--tRNA ligase [Planctomycetota bacterium]
MAIVADPAPPRTRILSGIQPSGRLHLGNYFGAIRQHLELQATSDCFYFIANYHALTTVKEPAALRRNTLDVAATYLALGLDPDRTVFFRQSDVPEVCELTWLLMTVTGMGLLERAHSYKDKIARGIKPSVGLFAYPVLMASDILAYRPRLVPVGKDQEQHVEMAQDMAASFHHAFGTEVFVRPEPRFTETARVPGTDWERGPDGSFLRDERGRRVPQKMSKSYGNTLEIFAEGRALKRAVGRIPTDSVALENPIDPDDCLVFQLCALFLEPDEQAELRARYRAGGFGYGRAKEVLLAQFDRVFGPYRERKQALDRDPDTLEDILRAGGARARAVARATLNDARRACGID